MKNPIKHDLVRKLIIALLTALFGTFLLIGINALFPGKFPPPVEIGLVIFVLLIVAAAGITIEERLGRKQRSEPFLYNPGILPHESEIFKLNQELYSRTQEHTTELDRLNVELQLQMAMVQQAVGVAQTNEERFRNLADNIQEGLTIIENGELVYVNERACEIFGDCPDGDLDNRIKNFAIPEEQTRLASAI